MPLALISHGKEAQNILDTGWLLLGSNHKNKYEKGKMLEQLVTMVAYVNFGMSTV